MGEKKVLNYTVILSVIIILLLVVIGEIYYFNKSNTKIDTQKTIKIKEVENDVVKIVMITDKRCGEKCNLEPIIKQLKEIPSLSSMQIEEKDYSEKSAKDILKSAGINRLPAVIFQNNTISELGGFLLPTKDKKYFLNIGGDFDPLAEICNNKIDDNNDGKTDCEDSVCSKTLSCAPKVKKPKAELYVMSYCPFGTQAEKGYLEVINKLGKVADVKIKYVDYLMHGKKEGDQNIRQNCIQEEQNDKFYNYMKCFLKEGKAKECLDSENIDSSKLDKCISKTEKEIKYNETLKNSTGRYPKFNLDTEENKKYGVAGSPTFVLNGLKVDGVGRNSKSYADLICNSFENKPKECEFDFNNTTYDPNFGFTSNGKVVEGGCGQ